MSRIWYDTPMIFFLILIAFIGLVMPFPKPNRFRWLRQHHAHRGLYDELHPENTLGAFENAISEGLGIECDVRLSKDDKVIMMHDPTLKRLCNINKRLDDFTYEELQSLKIANTEYSFIDLETFLQCVDGQVPIMIEIKPTSQAQKIVDMVYHQLESYVGNVSVISFDPRIVAMCKRKKENDRPVGQIIEVHFKNKTLSIWQRFALTFNIYQRYSKADFVSVNVDLFPFYQWMTWFGVCVGVWAIRSKKMLSQCRSNNIAILEKEAL